MDALACAPSRIGSNATIAVRGSQAMTRRHPVTMTCFDENPAAEVESVL
jgi:hypothetical protein